MLHDTSLASLMQVRIRKNLWKSYKQFIQDKNPERMMHSMGFTKNYIFESENF